MLFRSAWPACCCRRGGKTFSWRRHTEDVVVWTTLNVTHSRKVSLGIPVCDPCWFRSWYWFAGAAVCAGIPMAIGYFHSQLSDALQMLFLVGFVAAIGLTLAGLKAKPIRILRFTPEPESVRLKIRNDAVADVLSKSAINAPSAHRPARHGLLVALVVTLVVAIAVGLFAKH